VYIYHNKLCIFSISFVCLITYIFGNIHLINVSFSFSEIRLILKSQITNRKNLHYMIINLYLVQQIGWYHMLFVVGCLVETVINIIIMISQVLSWNGILIHTIPLKNDAVSMTLSYYHTLRGQRQSCSNNKQAVSQYMYLSK
jgi:hypothetical protein